MISLLAQPATGLPGSVQPGPLLALLHRLSGAIQGLARCGPCPGSSEASWNGAESPCAPSTSYTSASHQPLQRSHSLLTGSLQQHHQHQHHQHSHLPGRQHLLETQGLASPFTNPLQLQQIRCYRIPNKVLQPKVPYSVRSGRPAPQPWPEFEAIKAAPGEIRWQRSVVRFPADVSAEIEEGGPQGRMLVLSGKAGTIRLSLQTLDPTGLLSFRLLHMPAAEPAATTPATAAAKGTTPAAAKGTTPTAAVAKPGEAGARRSLLVLVSPDRARFEAVAAELNKAIRGVMTGYLLGLTVKGVGYRMEPVEEGAAESAWRPPVLNAAQLARRARTPGNSTPKPYYFEASSAEKQNVTFPYNKPASAIRLKVGYSRTAVYPLPPHIRAFFLKPTLVYLYGLELDELKRVAAEIRAIRKPNAYTGNGVLYLDEVVKLKQRAGAK